MGWLTPGRNRFAAKFLRALRKAGAKDPVRYDEEHFRILVGEGAFVNLHNAYAEYCAAPLLVRGRVIASHVAAHACGTGGLPDVFDRARAGLLPRIRERAYHATNRLVADLQGHKYPEQELRIVADDLTLELCYDTPHSVMSFDKAQLGTWRIEFDEALEIAASNLRARSRDPFEEARPGVFVSPWHDNHDVSRMWLADVIRRVPVKGDPVAFLPGRDHLVVAGADDEPGLAAAAAFVRSLIEEETRFMTGYPFRLRGDRWERFRAPDGHPAGEALQLLTCHTLSFDHRQQKELLDAIHEKQGDDTFVTDLMVVRKDGVLGTVASWGEGCRALLPRADQVGLSSAAVTKIASWDHVQAVAGDLLEPTDLYPARYRTLGFPSPEQLAKL